jgi:hypothetical protein
MPYAISYLHPSRFASYIAALALSLLLSSATQANAESLTAPTVAEESTATAAESAPPASAAQPVTSTSMSAPSEALSAADPPAPEPAGSQQSSPPVSPAGLAQTSKDSSSTAASEAGGAAAEVAAVAASTVKSLPLPAQHDSAVLPTDRVTRPVTEIRREAGKAVGSATSAASAAARALDRANPINRVQALAHEQLQRVGSTLKGELDRFAPATPRIPSLVAGGVDPTSQASSPVSPLPSAPGSGSDGASPFERVIPMDGWLRPFPAVPGDAAFPLLLTPNLAGSASGAPGLALAGDAGGVSLDRLRQHVETSPPPGGDGPAPLPDLPQLIASGASSSFAQSAALLALLALAAPAILRWLREVPGFRAPTPFVCALERPG